MNPSADDQVLDELIDRVLRRILDSERLRASSESTVAIGSDHRGRVLKETLKAHLPSLGFTPLDCGTFSESPADYPDIAEAVALRVVRGQAWRGIAIDGAGIGSCIAANKVPGIRAALCYNQASAVNSVEHNDANVLTLGASAIGPELAQSIVATWLETRFAGGRHAARIEKIRALERRYASREGADSPRGPA